MGLSGVLKNSWFSQLNRWIWNPWMWMTNTAYAFPNTCCQHLSQSAFLYLLCHVHVIRDNSGDPGALREPHEASIWGVTGGFLRKWALRNLQNGNWREPGGKGGGEAGVSRSGWSRHLMRPQCFPSGERWGRPMAKSTLSQPQAWLRHVTCSGWWDVSGHGAHRGLSRWRFAPADGLPVPCLSTRARVVRVLEAESQGHRPRGSAVGHPRSTTGSQSSLWNWFYCSTVDLQCSFHFHCTAKQFSSTLLLFSR